MKKENIKTFYLSIKSSIFIVLAIIAIVITGTYAWLNWRSNYTAMMLTIGDIRKVQVTLKPYTINTSFAPANTYTGEDYVTVTAVNNSTNSGMIRLYYKINSIDATLKASTDFKYTITKAKGNTYEVLREGNFTTATAGNDYIIMTDSIEGGNTTSTYRVYVWLESNGNQEALSELVFDAELRADIDTGAYTAVDYIESSGTQYIDTGVYPDIDTKIELEAMATMTDTTSKWYQVTGERTSYHHESAIQSAYNPSRNGDSLATIDYGAGDGYISVIVPTNTRYSVVIANNGHYINGVAQTQVGTFSGTAEYSLWIFDENNAGTGERGFIGRIYSYKVYQDGELIRYYIPARRSSDSVLGLYDVVNNNFVTTPSGTGKFTTKLPDTYQSVNYLESSGTQYIDTNFNHTTGTTSYELDIAITSLPNTYHTLFESRITHDGNEAYYIGVQSNGSSYGCIGGNKVNSLGWNIVVNQRYLLYLNPSVGVTVNGTTYSMPYTVSTTYSKSDYIFALNSAGSVIEPTIAKLYGMKIYDNGILIRHFVPCLRKSDQKPGLYDLVNGAFYVNAGSGEFTVG